VSIEKEPVVKESDQDVMFHYFRVKGVEAMKEASVLADFQEYGDAKEKISTLTEDLKKELDATKEEVKDFILELESALQRVSSSEYQRSGRYYMAQSVRGQYGERSYDTGRGVHMTNTLISKMAFTEQAKNQNSQENTNPVSRQGVSGPKVHLKNAAQSEKDILEQAEASGQGVHLTNTYLSKNIFQQNKVDHHTNHSSSEAVTGGNDIQDSAFENDFVTNEREAYSIEIGVGIVIGLLLMGAYYYFHSSRSHKKRVASLTNLLSKDDEVGDTKVL